MCYHNFSYISLDVWISKHTGTSETAAKSPGLSWVEIYVTLCAIMRQDDLYQKGDESQWGKVSEWLLYTVHLRPNSQWEHFSTSHNRIFIKQDIVDVVDLNEINNIIMLSWVMAPNVFTPKMAARAPFWMISKIYLTCIILRPHLILV